MTVPELLSIEQTAQLLKIGRSRAYSMAAAGQLPGVIRIGRSLRVSRERLAAWIEEGVAANDRPAPWETGNG